MLSLLMTSFVFPPPSNGVAEVAMAHATGLANLGYKVTVATGRNNLSNTAIFPDNIKIEQFDVTGYGKRGVGYSGEIEKYKTFIREFNGDVIFCHAWENWATDLAVSQFPYLNCKKILVSHGVFSKSLHLLPRNFYEWYLSIKNPRMIQGILKDWFDWRPYLKKMPEMLVQFDHVVFLSDVMTGPRFYDRRLANKMRLKNWSIIPNAANPPLTKNNFSNFRSTYHIGEGPLILCVGNYSRIKDQEMALRAFVKAQCPDASLVFIGAENEYWGDRLKRLYSDFTKNKNVNRVLFLEDLDKDLLYSAYQAADIFLLSSRTEVQPLVLLDAMAYGLPFISTNVGSIRQLPGGIVVNGESEMARGIKNLINDPSKRLKLSKEGRTAYMKKFNWKNIVDNYDLLLRNLVGPQIEGYLTIASQQ